MRLTTSRSALQMDVGKGIVAASSRCWILKPEGPAAVSLGKECRMANILKSGPIVAGVDGINGATGGGQLGCLDNNNRHVISVLGASPEERSRRLAFPNRPALAMETADSICLFSFS